MSGSVARRLYAWWLRRQLVGRPLPRHLALIMDGNRRWARLQGWENPSLGHRQGAAHLESVLGWCAELGIDHVTVWVASADNIRKRNADEVAFLMHLAETTIARRLVDDRRWRVRVAGQLDLLPASTARALKEAEEATRDLPEVGSLTIAIGYSGRQEIVDAVRDLLEAAAADGRSLDDLATHVSEAEIARHLYTSELPYPELVIRTSGEQRMSDFLLWQSVRSELHFVDAYWPAFGQLDLLRTLRTYASRRSGASREA